MAAHYFGTVENNVTGRPVSGASVWVLTGPSAEGGTAVTLFSDESVTEVSNPVTTNSYGFYEFYVADGHYTLEYAYNGEVRAVIEDVEIAESGAGDVGALELRMDAAEIVTSNATVVAFTGLADPDADRLPFWDESANTFAWLEVGAGLSLSGTTLTTTGAGSGDITASGLTMSTARLLGRTTASSGAVEEITVGSGLSLSAGALAASGLASTSQTAEQISGFIASPSDKSYTIAVKMAHGGTITETTTVSASGTCTATWKVNSTALGGAANSVSSAEQSQAHASSNTFVAGDDIVLTVSSNSTCADMSFTIKYTRTLA